MRHRITLDELLLRGSTTIFGPLPSDPGQYMRVRGSHNPQRVHYGVQVGALAIDAREFVPHSLERMNDSIRGAAF